jgi:hypothetical protein
MPAVTDDFRLLWAVILFCLPMIAGYRFARKLQSPLGAISDAILIGYLIQYISVGVTGICGILSPFWLTLAAILINAALWIVAELMLPKSKELSAILPHGRWVLGICLGAIGFGCAIVYFQRLQPPLATDALTYHLPAAIFWLQQHRIVVFQAWFFNPANTYSPLAGSMFVTYLLAPIGNDALARFVQIGPWILILFTTINLARSGGALPVAAALAGLATVLSRPFISECILAKDDLFVAAFFLVVVAGLSGDKILGKFGAARIGIAIGLLLATKYTALLTLPILLLAADAPIRAAWRWRQYCVAAGAALLIAGPWYLRNLIDYGNPLFPVKINIVVTHLPGLLAPIHVAGLRTIGGLWQVITAGYFGQPPPVFIFLGVVWLAAIFIWRRTIRVDPVRRLIVLGPPVGIATFALFSPQAEVRFLLPVFGLMFVSSACVARGKTSMLIVTAVAVMAVATSFSSDNWDQIVKFAMWGAVVALVGVAIRWIEADWFRLRQLLLSAFAAAMLFIVIRINWNVYLSQYRDSRDLVWQAVYPPEGELWVYVDENIPTSATIAYSNQFMIDPLYGFDLKRHVVYAPVRAKASVSTLVFPDRVSDTDLFQKAIEAANVQADPLAWRENLKAAAAQYLVVGLQNNAPEIRWASADPLHFVKLFANEEAAVYRIQGLY